MVEILLAVVVNIACNATKLGLNMPVAAANKTMKIDEQVEKIDLN
jgi:hypothetical protein